MRSYATQAAAQLSESAAYDASHSSCLQGSCPFNPKERRTDPVEDPYVYADSDRSQRA